MHCYLGDQPGYGVKLFDSHDGLICLVTTEGMFLWNPTTRVHARLPSVDVDRPPGLRRLDGTTGFGYCKSSEEYKVFIIFSMFGSAVKIYSQKSNSWKIMEGYNYKSMVPDLNSGGKLVNGKLHFLMSPASEEVGCYIVSIDLDSEMDGIIDQPDYRKGSLKSKHTLGLGVLGGCLCAFASGCCRQDSLCNLDLWVLKEYGVKESWTKLMTMVCIGDPGEYVYLNPLFILLTGEILLVHEKELAIYNPRDYIWTYHRVSNVKSFRDAFIHVESLVSPLLNAN